MDAAARHLPFEEDSMLRQVYREGVLLLGGGRALLMQVAHPLVARGVAEHSSFRADRLQRLLRTLRPTLAIVFGSREQALAAASSINQVHERVSGRGYSATDPDLLLWVHATLVDTSLYMYRRFVGPLTTAGAAAYYEDICRVGALLGIADETMPDSLDDMLAYTREMCQSLEVTEEARDICDALFDAGPAMWPVMLSVRQLTAGLLPERLRDQFGLGWGDKRERTLQTLASASRVVLPRLPGRLKQPPWFLMP